MNSPDRGSLAVHFLKSLGAAKGDLRAAIAYAGSQNWRDATRVIDALQKSAVDPIGTTDAAAFITPTGLDIAEFVRPLSIVGRLALRRVPFRTKLVAATGGTSAHWVGENQPKPLSKATLDGDSALDPLKVAAVMVLTEELLRSAAPGAETTLSQDLGRACASAMDVAFIDVANAGVAGQMPASVTNGATPFASSGSTLAAIDADLGTLVDALSAAGSDLLGATWVLRPQTAIYLAKLRGSGGALAHPGMTARGGTLLGVPAITSANVPDVGSPGEATITLLDASQIWLGDDGGSDIQMARHASIAMQDDPSAPAQQVSLWQNNLVALRVERFLNWRVCRDGMAQVLDGVAY